MSWCCNCRSDHHFKEECKTPPTDIPKNARLTEGEILRMDFLVGELKVLAAEHEKYGRSRHRDVCLNILEFFTHLRVRYSPISMPTKLETDILTDLNNWIFYLDKIQNELKAVVERYRESAE